MNTCMFFFLKSNLLITRSVVERHLSDKSVSRLAGVFAIASRGELLDSLFAGQVDEDVLKLSRMLRKELDRGLL